MPVIYSDQMIIHSERPAAQMKRFQIKDQINEIICCYPAIFWRGYVYIYSGRLDTYSTDLAYLKEDLDKKLHPMVFDAMGIHGPLVRYVKLRLAHAPGMSGTFPRHRLQTKPLLRDPGMHHDTCVTHVPWCMSGSLTRGGEENVPSVPGACATRIFTYLGKRPIPVASFAKPPPCLGHG